MCLPKVSWLKIHLWFSPSWLSNTSHSFLHVGLIRGRFTQFNHRGNLAGVNDYIPTSRHVFAEKYLRLLIRKQTYKATVVDILVMTRLRASLRVVYEFRRQCFLLGYRATVSRSLPNEIVFTVSVVFYLGDTFFVGKDVVIFGFRWFNRWNLCLILISNDQMTGVVVGRVKSVSRSFPLFFPCVAYTLTFNSFPLWLKLFDSVQRRLVWDVLADNPNQLFLSWVACAIRIRIVSQTIILSQQISQIFHSLWELGARVFVCLHTFNFVECLAEYLLEVLFTYDICIVESFDSVLEKVDQVVDECVICSLQDCSCKTTVNRHFY